MCSLLKNFMICYCLLVVVRSHSVRHTKNTDFAPRDTFSHSILNTQHSIFTSAIITHSRAKNANKSIFERIVNHRNLFSAEWNPPWALFFCRSFFNNCTSSVCALLSQKLKMTNLSFCRAALVCVCVCMQKSLSLEVVHLSGLALNWILFQMTIWTCTTTKNIYKREMRNESIVRKFVIWRPLHRYWTMSVLELWRRLCTAHTRDVNVP